MTDKNVVVNLRTSCALIARHFMRAYLHCIISLRNKTIKQQLFILSEVKGLNKRL